MRIRKSSPYKEAERDLAKATTHREVTSVTIAAQQSLTPGEFAHFLRKVKSRREQLPEAR